MLLLAVMIAGSRSASAQDIDYSNCPDCSAADISLVQEIKSKYQGIKGSNPAAPSTYRLIGNHKFSGGGYGLVSGFFGENWYTIRTPKQYLTGVVHSFGVSDYGDESDWNIHVVPDQAFQDLLSDAIPYQSDNWYASGDWGTDDQGHFTIEAEITPDERRYGNPWFSNREHKTLLKGRRITAYGPFLREEAHGNHPEIHPCEQLWWNEPDGSQTILLIVDDSNRFFRRADTVATVNGQPTFVRGDYTSRQVTTRGYQPWTQEKGQESEFLIPFEVDPAREGLFLGVQALDAQDFCTTTRHPDISNADRANITYRGEVVLSAAPTMNPESSSLTSSLAGQLGGLSSLVGLKTTGPDITEEAIATLQSRSFTQSFVERHNLLPILFASDWDAANSKWNTDDVPTLGDAFKLFDKHIREVIEDSKTGLVTLRVDWRDRELAAQWANQMVADLNQQLRERAIKDADKGIQYLDAELAKTSVLDIQLAIDGLLSNELHTIMLANVNEEYAFRVIDPAIVSDEDDFVWPMRLVLIAGGLLLGMIIGVLAAFLREGSREPAAAHR